jgi:hypothetical protein
MSVGSLPMREVVVASGHEITNSPAAKVTPRVTAICRNGGRRRGFREGRAGPAGTEGGKATVPLGAV